MFVPHFQAPTLAPSFYATDDGIPPLAPYNISWPLQRLLSALSHAYATNSDLRTYIDSTYFPSGSPLRPSVPCKFAYTIRAYLQQYPSHTPPPSTSAPIATSSDSSLQASPTSLC